MTLYQRLRSLFGAKVWRFWITYGSLKKVMECALLAGGTNKYTLPHMGKARLRRQNQFKRILKVQGEAIDIGFEKLRPF